MGYWIGIAILSFGVAILYGFEKLIGVDIPCVDIPEFLAALAFAMGLFAAQTAHNIFSNESLVGHLATQFSQVLGQLDYTQDLIQRNEELKRDIIDRNEELKKEMKKIGKRIDEALTRKPIDRERGE